MRPPQPGHPFSFALVAVIVAITAIAYLYPGNVADRPFNGDDVRLMDPVQATLQARAAAMR